MLCPVCTKEKERKDFKRLATLSQTKAWLRNPLASKRMTYIGKECNDCHKQTKRKYKDLTPVELQKRLINQGVNPIKIEAQVEADNFLAAIMKNAELKKQVSANE